MALNPCQEFALQELNSRNNIFLTGAAGTGKSYVVKRYLKSLKTPVPILASTGAAAVLVGGRTFHSFFGLGIMEGGIHKTVERAVKAYKVKSRIKKTHEIVLDEISMIPPQAFEAADLIARAIRGNTSPFGGIRMILTGDFFQLPPVDRFHKETSMLFEIDSWKALGLRNVELTEPMRSTDEEFLSVLKRVRYGICDKTVEDFLQARKRGLQGDFLGTVLFPRKDSVDEYNHRRLQQLESAEEMFETEVQLSSKSLLTREQVLAYAPLPERLRLKREALVMIRKNDPDGGYVNGSLGIVKKMEKDALTLELVSGGEVVVEPENFQILDADGEVQCTIRNFPVTLGWASTIHKSQGASIDSLHLDLKRLWENGHAYVAISRAKNPSRLFVEDWDRSSIKSNPKVIAFHQRMTSP